MKHLLSIDDLDRAAIERILDRARDRGYGVRTLVHESVQDDLFLSK